MNEILIHLGAQSGTQKDITTIFNYKEREIILEPKLPEKNIVSLTKYTRPPVTERSRGRARRPVIGSLLYQCDTKKLNIFSATQILREINIG